jgi:hypothetical protein
VNPKRTCDSDWLEWSSSWFFLFFCFSFSLCLCSFFLSLSSLLPPPIQFFSNRTKIPPFYQFRINARCKALDAFVMASMTRIKRSFWGIFFFNASYRAPDFFSREVTNLKVNTSTIQKARAMTTTAIRAPMAPMLSRRHNTVN